MAVLVVVWGASPGVGKSTLCAGLSAQLAAAGLRVDHFRDRNGTLSLLKARPR
jgi:predicted kinase